MERQWRKCPGFADYDINEWGVVRRATAGRGAKIGKAVKAFVTAKDNRPNIILRKDGQSHHRRIGRLVCEAWWGPPPFDGAEACHNDGDPQNNHYTNLRWDTRKGNFADMVAHGTRRTGARHHLAKLSLEQIQSIRDLYRAGGITQRELGERFGTAQGHISRIVNGVRWDSH